MGRFGLHSGEVHNCDRESADWEGQSSVGEAEQIEPGEVLERLMRVIESRQGGRPEESYTAALLAGGVELIGEKVVEEAR